MCLLFCRYKSEVGLRKRLQTLEGVCQLIGCAVWAVCLIGFYLSPNGYSSAELFEARWLPATLAINGVMCLLFCRYKNEASFIAVGCSCLVAGPAAIVCFVVYLINSVKFFLKAYMLSSRNTLYIISGRKAYVQICVSLSFVCFVGILLVAAVLFKLYQLAKWHFGDLPASTKCRQNLQMTSGAQVGLALFSIYVTSQVMTVQLTYIRSYLVQELFCAVLLLTVSLLQCCTMRRFNKMFVIILALGNTMQFVQELTYAWTAYFVSVYLHSARLSPQQGYGYDQVIMTCNFAAHCARMCLCSYSAYTLIQISGAKILASPLKTELSRKTYLFIACLATGLMVVGTFHVMLDIVYMATHHVYRQLLASTGVSVFYANLAGVSLSIFIRHRRNFFLLPTAVFSINLISTSLHAIYIYWETTFTSYQVKKLREMGEDELQPTVMHFLEAVAAVCGLVLGGAVTVVSLRLLHFESRHERRTAVGGAMVWIRRITAALAFTTVLELACVIRLKTKWRLNDAVSNYGLLDGVSMAVNCCLLAYVGRQSDAHLRHPLLVVFVHLLGETLASLNYIQSQSGYVQLLIVFNQATADARVRLKDLFPLNERATIFFAHALQVVQWALVVGCLLTVGACLEMIAEGDADCPLSVVEAPANNGAVQATSLRDVGQQHPQVAGPVATLTLGESTTTCTYSNPAYNADALHNGDGRPLTARPRVETTDMAAPATE